MDHIFPCKFGKLAINVWNISDNGKKIFSQDSDTQFNYKVTMKGKIYYLAILLKSVKYEKLSLSQHKTKEKFYS